MAKTQNQEAFVAHTHGRIVARTKEACKGPCDFAEASVTVDDKAYKAGLYYQVYTPDDAANPEALKCANESLRRAAMDVVRAHIKAAVTGEAPSGKGAKKDAERIGI